MTRAGRTARLPQQPLRILIELYSHAGEVVTREQLVKALWPQGVVDFDNGLNVAMRKLRVALDDVRDTPRYIETLPRVGYRFIAQPEVAAAAPLATRRASPATWRALAIAGALVLIGGVLYGWLGTRDEPAVASSRHVPSPRAQELYVQGMHERSRRDVDATPQAIARLEAAIEEDPLYAEAWAGYSRALSSALVRQLAPPGELLPKIRAAAERALALDPAVPDAHVTLIHVHMDFDKDFAAAARDLARVRELGIESASLWHYSAMWNAQQGNVEAGLADMRRARALAAVGRYDEALSQLQARKDIGPWQGDLGVLYARMGRREDARREIARLEALQERGFAESYDLAAIHAALGDLDRGCEMLDRALEDGSFHLNWMRLDPRMDPLRGRQCFADVEERLFRIAG